MKRFVILFIMLEISMLGTLAQAAPQTSATTDGSTSGECGTGNCSAILTTTKAADIIIVFAGAGVNQLPSISDTASLTWTTRVSAFCNTTCADWISEFYAKPSGILTSDNITITTSATFSELIAFGVTGTTRVFDTSRTLPSKNAAGVTGSTAIASVSMTTDQPNDFIVTGVIGAVAPTYSVNSGITSNTIGLTLIKQLNVQDGFASAWTISTSQLYSTNIGYTTSFDDDAAIIGDALQISTTGHSGQASIPPPILITSTAPWWMTWPGILVPIIVLVGPTGLLFRIRRTRH